MIERNPFPKIGNLRHGLLIGILLAVVLFVTLALARSPVTGQPAASTIILIPYADGFTNPVDIANAGDGRLFIVEQGGTIRIIDAEGNVLAEPFLQIPPSELTSGGEQGLLGLVFHPEYVNNGYFYVNYTDENGDTHISRFSRDPLDPNQADPASELILLAVDQPFSNHNAGDLAFGPDGYLYIPLGDGGLADDPGDRAQNPMELLGKILRLDVDGTAAAGPDCGAGGQYTIPADNPLVDGPGGNCDEIWALGLRNPWRFSFDRLTGDLYIGDVGQYDYEEINFQPADSSGGENYGWRCYEGNEPGNEYDPAECTADYTFPIFVYPHSQNGNFLGCATTGGYVYRGSQFPLLYGTYIFADYCSDNFWTLQGGPGGWEATFLGDLGSNNPSSFGEDNDGELYVADFDGQIYQVQTTQVQRWLPIMRRD